MLDRIRNSWELVKASFGVLQADKELVLFPVISMVGVIIVTLSFAVPMLLAGFVDSLTAGDANGILSIVIGFFFYAVMYTVIIFSNAALVGAAMIRLDGGDPTLSDGFRIAQRHIGAIIGYALISATVGIVLRAISERGGIIGQIASSLLGFAWNVVTFLVVPILVVEGVSPADAIRRSGILLKKTWGEQIVGNFSINTIFGLITFGVIVLSVPLVIMSFATKSVALIITVIVLLVLIVVGIGLVSSTLSGIYAAAVYRYAVHGDSGGFFDEHLIQGAFRQK